MPQSDQVSATSRAMLKVCAVALARLRRLFLLDRSAQSIGISPSEGHGFSLRTNAPTAITAVTITQPSHVRGIQPMPAAFGSNHVLGSLILAPSLSNRRRSTQG